MENSGFKNEDTNPLGIGAEAPAESGGTRVDLGEDLLEGTRAGAPDKPPESETKAPEPPAETSTEEEIANGEILIGEKIYDEAKKVLRRVLRRDPSSIKAKELLLHIQEREIQELLTNDSRPSQRLGSSSTDEQDAPAAVVESLERELRLNLDRAEVRAVPDLFPDSVAEAAYTRRTLEAAAKLAPRDVMDLGIAHMEMGLYGAAKAIFEELVKFDEYKISGMYLLGMALIHADECVEATIRLEPLVRDLTLTEPQKADFLYMMGLAFERLGERIKARDFYRRVHLLNPRYRDVMEKLR